MQLHVFTTVAPLLDDPAVPDGFRDEVGELARGLRLRNAFLLLEMSRFLPALESDGHHPVVLKGAALAETIYRKRGERIFSDLDILVEGSDVAGATATLGRFGYEPAKTSRPPDFYARHHFHRVLVNPSGITVEIHWDLSTPGDYVRFDLEALRRRAATVDAEGIPIRVLSPPDQLLHAASQALREGFNDLKRVVDAGLLLESGAASDVDLADRARRQGLGTAIWTLLRLVEWVTGREVAAELRDAVAPGRLTRRCIESLGLPEKTLSLYTRRRTGLRHLLRWLHAPSARAAARDLMRFVFPGEADFLDHGFQPDSMPGSLGRARITARRLLSLSKAAGYQSWCLLFRRSGFQPD